MRLHGIRRTGRASDRPAEQYVVAEEEVRGNVLTNNGRVRLDPGVELIARAVLEQPHAIALVVVEHEDRQEAADVGPHDLRAADVEPLGVRFLADDGHVVPLARPLPRELARVDVRARAAQQVPVPDDDPHAR